MVFAEERIKLDGTVRLKLFHRRWSDNVHVIYTTPHNRDKSKIAILQTCGLMRLEDYHTLFSGSSILVTLDTDSRLCTATPGATIARQLNMLKFWLTSIPHGDKIHGVKFHVSVTMQGLDQFEDISDRHPRLSAFATHLQASELTTVLPCIKHPAEIVIRLQIRKAVVSAACEMHLGAQPPKEWCNQPAMRVVIPLYDQEAANEAINDVTTAIAALANTTKNLMSGAADPSVPCDRKSCLVGKLQLLHIAMRMLNLELCHEVRSMEFDRLFRKNRKRTVAGI